MRLRYALLVLSMLLLAPVRGQAQGPALREADRVRLAEAFRLADAVQDRVWAGWSEVPFAVLLVTEEWEYLVRHPQPTEEFARLGYDELLGSEVLARPRVYPTTWLATFPAVGGRPTVVVGTPEATRLPSTRWVLTLLHEHFHQLQTMQPGYYDGVNGLDLANGDETGMWMLNYPFPYSSRATIARFNAYRDALAAAVTAEGTADFGTRVAALTTARRAFLGRLDAKDARYLAFQLWQEGTARYTEYRVAEMAATGYTPSPAFLALPDAVHYATASEAMRADLARELTEADLSAWQRGAFYTVGAAEALVLDAVQPGWQRRYHTEPFALEPYLSVH